MTQNRGFVPDEIVVSRDRGEIRLVLWDGQNAAIAASSLRAACRCAWCTRDRILASNAVVSDKAVEAGKILPDTVAFKDVAVLGSHGLHVKFSDGHERGIYPWAYLDELARGAEPTAAPPSIAATSPAATDLH